jgi:integrase/recombinase XerD
MVVRSPEQWLAGFQEHLQQQEYKPQTVQRAVANCRRFLAFIQARQVSLDHITPTIVDAYLTEQLRRYEHRHQRLPQGVNAWPHLFNHGLPGFLRSVLGQWPPVAQPTSAQEGQNLRLLNEYGCWLTEVRGLAPQTITGLQAEAGHFLSWLTQTEPPHSLGDLSVREVDAWFAYRLPTKRRSTTAHLVHSFRHFLRWLFQHGWLQHDLAPLVTAPSLYAFESLPTALKQEDIDRVLATTCQDHSPRGRRDFAILTLLATYGVRAGEIVTLRLEDVDWRNERLTIRHSKTRTASVLPLLTSTGEALLAYLQQGRPHSSVREIFLRSKAPYQPFHDGSSLHTLVTRRLQHAGVVCRGKHGPHAFRHARALSLLRTHVSLKTIGDILGHRATKSTTAYLRLATEDLRSVGLDIPASGEVHS